MYPKNNNKIEKGTRINAVNGDKKGSKFSLDQYTDDILSSLKSERNWEKSETLSHYYLSSVLAKSIPTIEKFLSSNKKLDSYIGDYDMFVMSLLPFMLTSFKESFMGKRGNSWKNCLKSITNDTLNQILGTGERNLLRNYVTILNGPSDLSTEKIITEIRNGILHTHYIVCSEGLVIRNPQNSNPKIHPYNFEAIVKPELLGLLIGLGSILDKKKYSITADFNPEIFDIPHNFDEIIDKIHFTKNIIRDNDSIIKEDFVLNVKQYNLLKHFYENKKVKMSVSNLRVSAGFLKGMPEPLMYEILYTILNKYTYKGLDLNELFGDIFKNMSPGDRLSDYALFSIQDPQKKDFLTKFLNTIKTKKQGNGQLLLFHNKGINEYMYKYCKDMGLKYNVQKKTFENDNFEIGIDSISLILSSLQIDFLKIKYSIEMFSNWLKLQFIKSVYTNELIPLNTEEREHIRNALAHNRYITLPGVEDVILSDSYKNGIYEREEMYNLSKIYKETYDEMVHIMKDKRDLNMTKVDNK